jgi:hypothetical protein
MCRRLEEITMRRFALITISLVVLARCAVMAAATAPTTDKKVPDARLAQLVSIECKDVRVHTVVSRLSQMTGVVMAAGADDNDWRSRDIPIVVRVKDIPLGRLLYAIADATHLHLARFQKGDDKPYYRMYRTTRRQNEIDGNPDARREAAVAIGEWDWDMWRQLKDLPIPETDTGPTKYGISPRDPMVRGFSEVIASLSQKDRDMVLAGGALNVRYDGASDSLRKSLEKCFRGTYANNARLYPEAISFSDGHYGTRVHPELTQDMMLRSFVRIQVLGLRQSVGQDLGLMVNTYIAISDQESATSACSTSMMHEALRQLGYDLSPRPEAPEEPGDAPMNGSYSTIDLCAASDLPMMKVRVKLEAPKDKTMMKANVKLEAPKDKTQFHFADALCAISKAAGFNLVYEDFDGHRPIIVSEDPEAGITLCAAAGWDMNIAWSFDSKNNTLMGQAKEWIQRHRNLVPEKIITTLVAKLNGPGVGLDDLEPLADLTHDQRIEWIWTCQDLKPLENHTLSHSPWKAYYSLTPEDKTRAKSDEGLVLGEEPLSMIKQTIQQNNPNGPNASPLVEVTGARIYGKAVGNKRNYTLELRAVIEGSASTEPFQLSGFPIYSAKREQELAKAAIAR